MGPGATREARPVFVSGGEWTDLSGVSGEPQQDTKSLGEAVLCHRTCSGPGGGRRLGGGS